MAGYIATGRDRGEKFAVGVQESGVSGAVRDEVAPCESAVRPHAAARGHPGGIFWKEGKKEESLGGYGVYRGRRVHFWGIWGRRTRWE